MNGITTQGGCLGKYAPKLIQALGILVSDAVLGLEKLTVQSLSRSVHLELTTLFRFDPFRFCSFDKNHSVEFPSVAQIWKTSATFAAGFR